MIAIYRNPVLFLAAGETLIWALLYYVFPALLLRWEQDLGWSKADITAAITIAVLISAAAAPLAGKLIDSGRGAAMMFASAMLGGFGLILLSFVTELWQFYATWAFIGLTMAGCLYEPCFAIVTRVRGADAKPAIVLITLVAGFASTLSFPSVHGLADAYGWRTTVVISGLLASFVAAPILWVGAKRLEAEHTETDTGANLPNPEDRNAFLRRSAFWYLAFAFTCVAVVHGAALHHLLPFLDERAVSDDMAVLAAAFIGPMQVAGRLAMMASEKFVSLHRIVLVTFGCLAVSMIVLTTGSGVPASLALFVILFGGAYGTVSILRPLVAREILGGRNFGAKSGALALPYLVGSASAPYLAAVVWGVGGYGLVFGISVGLSCAGCVLYLLAWTRMQSPG